jgi:hypothetical protein
LCSPAAIKVSAAQQEDASANGVKALGHVCSRDNLHPVGGSHKETLHQLVDSLFHYKCFTVTFYILQLVQDFSIHICGSYIYCLL